MSLLYLPPGHRALADTCALKYNIDRPCEEPAPTIQFTIDSYGYEASVAGSERTQGISANDYSTWNSTIFPSIKSHLAYCWADKQLVTAPTVNKYYDWVNNTGASVVISGVTLVAEGKVGTDGTTYPPQNALGIAAGQGMISAWELGSTNAAFRPISGCVVFRYLSGSTYYTITPTETKTLIDTGLYSYYLVYTAWPYAAQTPLQTPINKTWNFPTPVTIAATKRFRIQFYADGASSEGVALILAPVTVTLHLL